MLCARCQHSVDPGAAFCGNCGLQLTASSSLSDLAPPQAPALSVNPQFTVPPAPAAAALPAYEAPSQPTVTTPVPPAAPVTPVAPAAPVMPATPAAAAAPAFTIPAGGYAQYVAAPAAVPMMPAPASADHSGKAIASFVLSVLGIPACLIPFIGVIFGILAIVFGTLSIHSTRKVFAYIGMSLATVGLLASIFLWVHSAQALIKQRQTGITPSSSTASGPQQAISTPCYTTKIPASMKVTQTAGSCTFLGVDTAAGEQEEVKVLSVPQLTLSNLSTAAKNDAVNVVGAIPGGSISGQRSSTFAESQAYEITIKATDGSAGTISYVYDTTAQGNLVIVLHTQARATKDNYGVQAIEANWSWL